MAVQLSRTVSRMQSHGYHEDDCHEPSGFLNELIPPALAKMPALNMNVER